MDRDEGRNGGKKWRKEMEERDGGKRWRKVSYECYEHLSQANVAALNLTACQSNKAVNLKQASPRSTLSLARASPKAANIHNRWLSCRRQRSLRSSNEQYKIVLEEGEHMAYIQSLLVFALFEDVLLSFCETAGYVRFALFTSGYGYSPPSATLA